MKHETFTVSADGFRVISFVEPAESRFSVSVYMKGFEAGMRKLYGNTPNNTRYNTDKPSRYGKTDFGPNPFVVDISKATGQNNMFRTVLWSGEHMQLTLMSINVGEDIGKEIHPHTDQFIRIEEGQGLLQMGDTKETMFLQQLVYDDFAFIIPAGTWHNVTNTGNKPMKLYSIYAPPQHPWGAVHKTKTDAEAAEGGKV